MYLLQQGVDGNFLNVYAKSAGGQQFPTRFAQKPKLTVISLDSNYIQPFFCKILQITGRLFTTVGRQITGKMELTNIMTQEVAPRNNLLQVGIASLIFCYNMQNTPFSYFSH